MARSQRGTSSRSGSSSDRTVALDVLPTQSSPRSTDGGKSGGGKIARSRAGRWRAVVLLTVQGLIIAHVIHWLVTGRTTTPIEPSESMEFSKHGVVNVGLIFFALALLSTLILGRWFCGWACHVVLLQDACSWLLKRCGIRPKPFRSRLLIYVPLVLALYMFIWPMAYRWLLVPLDRQLGESLGAQHWLVETIRGGFGMFGVPLARDTLPRWEVSAHIMTEDFWGTFPEWWIAIPFLLICGFGVVYFLGSKGFCTYGCPYGGFFAPIDKLSPARIRVTDACDHSGHCTAVCSSNVRVHEEVAAYGMVVDPGCMKCMDCVSVCPNDALYFGFGAPAVKRSEPKPEFTPRPRKWDLSWRGEIGLALVFALAFFATRGVYGAVPMLMAVGISAMMVGIVWLLARMIARDSVNLHRYRLKYKGAVQPAGWVFGAIGTAAVVLIVHSGIVCFAAARGTHLEQRISPAVSAAFDGRIEQVSDAQRDEVRAALHWLRTASFIGEGGIGLLDTWQTMLDLRIAPLLVTLGEFDEATATVERAIERDGLSDGLAQMQGLILLAQGNSERAFEHYETVLAQHPEFTLTLEDYLHAAREAGEIARAEGLLRQRLERWPDDAISHRSLAMIQLERQAFEPAAESFRRALQIEPHQPELYVQLAGLHLLRNDPASAVEVLRDGVDALPDHAMLNLRLGELLTQLNRRDEAYGYLKRAEELAE